MDTKYALYVHDDSQHTFEDVITHLIDICGHNNFQAEQCASIIHNNGKCLVKIGEKQKLDKMRFYLLMEGLQTNIHEHNN